ncbi:DUF6058 family natural product biosynthesis protein [Terrabacter sp. NPDC080008]|uniref:DUF6058 family natural product biosynthesis protein n=1 Tax=Terrabacter sp. NPDC080008 TaxID=3155176 RepID=UPI00344F93FC
MTLKRVQQLYLELNGSHPMSAEDDAYVRRHFVPVPDTSDYPRDQLLTWMAQRELPLPSYLLSDGTPMVHPDYLEPLRRAGSLGDLEAWFVGHWAEVEQDVAEEEWTHGYLSGQYVCLWSVTPENIKAKTEAIEAIQAEIEALQQGRGSRSRLAAAVDRLDALEPPFTSYDEARFGGPTSRQVWIEDVRAAHRRAATVR